MKTVYLDYAATAPRNPDIVNKTATFSLSRYANIGRGLYTLSEEAQSLYRESKKTVAQWV
jgi:selenocysteine lyase/cysteine desulfurase